jgi:hypothetical protein
MPTLQRFGTVSIRIYADDHRPPHFHSRRMIAYYEKGERPIPRVVALATQELEVAQ